MSSTDIEFIKEVIRATGGKHPTEDVRVRLGGGLLRYWVGCGHLWRTKKTLWGASDIRNVECPPELWERVKAEMQGKPKWEDVPAWAHWLAQDKGGALWAYEIQPICFGGGSGIWGVGAVAGGRAECVGRGEVIGDWRDTLEARPVSAKQPYVTYEEYSGTGTNTPIGTVRTRIIRGTEIYDGEKWVPADEYDAERAEVISAAVREMAKAPDVFMSGGQWGRQRAARLYDAGMLKMPEGDDDA